LVRLFVNTLDIEEGTDALLDEEATRRWLQTHHLLSTQDSISSVDLAYLRSVRAAIRQALAANHAEAVIPREALATLNAAIAAAKVSPELDGAGYSLASNGAGVHRIVGTLAVEIIHAMTNQTWRRLKICLNDRCQWAFYDRSPARSGKWCSMSVCGNRTKQQVWRDRQS